MTTQAKKHYLSETKINRRVSIKSIYLQIIYPQGYIFLLLQLMKKFIQTKLLYFKNKKYQLMNFKEI